MRQIVLVAHNIRSAHNVGSLLRTCDGLGVKEVYLTGYTPYPLSTSDTRLPHLAIKTDQAIAKTALGAEKKVKWRTFEDLAPALDKLRTHGFKIFALEQAKNSISLRQVKPPANLALIIGNEVGGLSAKELVLTDQVIEIPMQGTKESFNVAVAAAMALYVLGEH